jgi:5-(carboxyamino)imidazole ribonucleotide synthase
MNQLTKTTMAIEQELVAPGGTLGIIGGGQLGRMTALAAARLGINCHIYCPDADSPAFSVAAAATCAAYDDAEALTQFAHSVDAVSFEFENIPAASARILADIVPVRPGWTVLETAQERVGEKSFFNKLGIKTAPWHHVTERAELERAIAAVGLPAVLKTCRFGYDGKGQTKIDAATNLDEAWALMGGGPAILEGFVNFTLEASVLIARGLNGDHACYDVVENRHRNHILDVTIAPAAMSRELALEAQSIAIKAANALDLVGLLAVELFVTADGQLLVNEMAPRPHNSGHWTMNACYTDQFEQFVRAVCGLPLGSAERFADAVMTNLIGDDIDRWPELMARPGTLVHLYGKSEARPGRKMGHVTTIKPRSDVPLGPMDR